MSMYSFYYHLVPHMYNYKKQNILYLFENFECIYSVNKIKYAEA